MKTLLTLLLLAASAFGQTATISDTIRTPFGGTFSGTVTVSLNSPALAQPLYSGNVTLSGWTQAVTVSSGVFTLTLYTNDLITPGGTSYAATYAPTSGSGWKETWIVPSGATTIPEIRSTTVPSPLVRFNPSQITQAGATLGQGLRWNGSIWAPASVIADPMTTNGDLITRLSGVPVRVGIGSTNQVLTVSGGMPVWASGITGNASTATALAANGTNCSAGSFALGVDASGNAEGCTAAVTASTGLSDSSALVRNNQANAYTAGSKQTFASSATTAGAAFGGGITADPSSVSAGDFWYRTDLGTFGFRNATAVDALVAGGRALTTPGSVPFVTAAGVLGQSANLFWDNANGRLNLGSTVRANGQVLNMYESGNIRYGIGVATSALRFYNPGSGNHTVFGTVSPADGTTFTEQMRLVGGTGNLLLGTTTDDGTNRLQVAGSVYTTGPLRVDNNDGFLGNLTTGTFLNIGSLGDANNVWVDARGTGANVGMNFRTKGSGLFSWFNTTAGVSLMTLSSTGELNVRNQTPTTGSTSLVVRAGAGQGSNNLTTWQNSGGTEVARVNAGGGFAAQEFFNLTNTFYQNGVNVDVGSGGIYRFASIASQGGTKDLSLSRASANTLQVGDGGANALGTVNARSIALATSAAFGTHITFDTNTGADGIITSSSAGSLQFGTTNAGPLGLIHNNVELLQLSPNTVTITNPTPTTGSTSLVVRAGAGQGSNNLQAWQNSGGTVMASVRGSDGALFAPILSTFDTQTAGISTSTAGHVNGLNLNSSAFTAWSSTSNWFATKDLSLSRASANTLQIGDGAANSNGTIVARIHTWANGTEGTCDATLRGQVVMVQGGAGVADTFRVCRKDAANAYAWTALY